MRVPDADVIKLMRLLTFMDMNEIRSYEVLMKTANYFPNTAQKRLAEEVTRNIHGQIGLDIALKVTQGAAPGSETVLDAQTLETISKDMSSIQLPIMEVVGNKIIDLLVKTELTLSKGDARRLIRNGGVYLNNKKIIDENAEIVDNDLIDEHLLLLSAGKKNKVLIRVT